ncbi:MAG: FtsX-like permease family protein [Polyangiaceae bacterium]
MRPRSHLALLAFAWGALTRRKGRTIALLGAVTMVVTLLGAVLFATSSLRGEAERGRKTQPDVIVQRLAGGRPALIDPTTLSFVEKLPGVKRAAARVWGYVFLPSLKANVTVIGRHGDAIDLRAVSGVLQSGRDVRPGERGAAVIGRALAELLHVRDGDVISLPSAREDAPTLNLVGVFDSPVALYTSDVILLDADDARAILDIPADRATDVTIELGNPQEAAVVTRAILDKEPELRVLDQRILTRTYQLTYGRRAGIVIAAALPALLAMLILAWERMSGLAPAERREIAVQKAVGWSTADVLYAKMYESALVGLLAFGAGIALAYAWVFLLGAPLLREVLSGWSVLYPETPLTPAVDPADLVGVAALVLLPFVSVAIFPAWRAAIVDPLQAMRS